MTTNVSPFARGEKSASSRRRHFQVQRSEQGCQGWHPKGLSFTAAAERSASRSALPLMTLVLYSRSGEHYLTTKNKWKKMKKNYTEKWTLSANLTKVFRSRPANNCSGRPCPLKRALSSSILCFPDAACSIPICCYWPRSRAPSISSTKSSSSECRLRPLDL